MSERLGIYSEVELEAARDLVRDLVRVVRSHRLYAGSHPTLSEMYAALRRRWDAATAGGPVSLRLTDRKVLLGEDTVYQVSGDEVIPSGLYEHGVAGLVFRRGLEPEEQRRFIAVLAQEPGPSVDYAALLWEADLKRVQVLLDDEDTDPDPVTTPEQFAERVARLGEPQDPPVGSDYDRERATVGTAGPQENGEVHPPPTEDDAEQFRALLEADGYMATVRHALRMVHAMMREELTPEEAGAVEEALLQLTGSVLASGELDAATETLARARRMIQSPRPLELRAGELTLEAFRDPEKLRTFFRRVDEHDKLDARALGECLVELGQPAAPVAGDWLLETRHPRAVGDAMRVFGDAATEVLAPLYASGGSEARERTGPALLEIGTPEALLTLAAQFADLPQPIRLQLLHLIARSKDAELRRVVVDALDDPAEPVRQAAIGALRRQDAPAVADVLRDFLERGVLETRYQKEAEEFFEMLSRIGDRAVARLLAEQCVPKGFRLAFWRPTALQQLCARSLRRMRSAAARPVVEKLRQSAPRAIREILDDPCGDLS